MRFTDSVFSMLQWRIQDFSDGGTSPWIWAKSLLFGKIFAENCMKMKEIALRGGIHPWRSHGPANVLFWKVNETCVHTCQPTYSWSARCTNVWLAYGSFTSHLSDLSLLNIWESLDPLPDYREYLAWLSPGDSARFFGAHTTRTRPGRGTNGRWVPRHPRLKLRRLISLSIIKPMISHLARGKLQN